MEAPAALDLDTLVPYLLRRQLLTSRDVVDPAFEVRDYSRRNRSFKVIAPEGSESLLVKQAGSLSDAEFRASLEGEAALLRAVGTDPALAPLRPYTPRAIDFDARDLVLVTELVHPATSITKYHLNRGEVRFPEDAAATCARLLADFHVAGARALAEGALPHVPERVPFIWDAFRTMDRLQEAGMGVYKMWLQVKERGAFWRRLDDLRKDWSARQGLVHLDVRWDNFLLTHGAGAARGMLNVRLIDWELTGRGDPAWDVTCYLSEYVRFWLHHKRPTETHHASARLFWTSYAKRAKLGKAADADLRARVKQHLPFTMLLIATEQVQRSDKLTPNALQAFDLALKAADEPDAFLKEWFGL